MVRKHCESECCVIWDLFNIEGIRLMSYIKAHHQGAINILS